MRVEVIWRLNVHQCDWTDGARPIMHSTVLLLFRVRPGIYIRPVFDSFYLDIVECEGRCRRRKWKKKQQLKAIWRTVERRPRRRPKICRSSRALSLLMIRRYSVSWSGTRRRHATQTPTGVSTSQQQSQSSDVLAAAARALNEWWMKSQQQQNFNIVYKYNINEKKLLTFQE